MALIALVTTWVTNTRPFFYLQYASSNYLRNVCNFLPECMTSHQNISFFICLNFSDGLYKTLLLDRNLRIWMQSTSSNPVSFWFILILCFHAQLDLLSRLFFKINFLHSTRNFFCCTYLQQTNRRLSSPSVQFNGYRVFLLSGHERQTDHSQ